MNKKNSAFPSADELLEAFPKLGAAKAEELRKTLADSLVDGEEAVDDAMEKANKLIDGNSVEAIEGDESIDRYWRKTILIYVNLGDTYETTLCYDTEAEEFFVGSWGDFVEEWEKGGEDEEDEEEEEEEEEGEEDESEDESEEEAEEEEEEEV